MTNSRDTNRHSYSRLNKTAVPVHSCTKYMFGVFKCLGCVHAYVGMNNDALLNGL